MANAGCINAIGFDGCFLRTLQCLDSSNIGVGVQYTAPNPLDDKRFDYIKYTDKCGCVQCLSAENEILIYATNGVIKNLTLTNDDVNEAIKIKWNDIFGSNRAKTIVRYKTGSYPVSITDGTLAVEETTKNQYSSTPFSLSGVLDETTYYISAFAVDSNNVVIGTQQTTITTSFGWHPSANTYLYYPLISNANDGSGNSRNGTISGTPVWNNGAVFQQNRRIDSVDTFPTTFTVSLFIKKPQTSKSEQTIWAKWFVPGYDGQGKLYQRNGIVSDASNHIRVYHATSSTIHQRDNIDTMNTTSRYHIVYTYDNGTVKVYVNKTLKITFSTTVQNNTNAILGIGGWAKQEGSSYSNKYNLTGTVREFIVESVAWSQSDVNDYYDKIIGKL